MFREVWAVYIGHAISEDPDVFLGANTKVTKVSVQVACPHGQSGAGKRTVNV